MLETWKEAENFLWSLVQGDNGTQTHPHMKLWKIRRMLYKYVDKDTYDMKCRARCHGRDNFGSLCGQQVTLSKKHCYHHRNA